MLEKKSKGFLSIGIIIILITFFFIFSGIKIPNRLTTYFEVSPVKRWILSKETQGLIISNVIDFRSVISNNFSITQFERGESANFRLAPSILNKPYLNKGDTVGLISSSSLRERITQLEGNLNIAEATLKSKSTGEKQALIEEAKNKVKFSDARISEKTLSFNRIEELFNKGYASKEEYEASLWELKQLKIENEINRAQLQALTTGLKNEDIKVFESTINAYKKELLVLRDRLQDFLLLAPISGNIIKNFSPDTLLVVDDTSQLILTSPIRFEESVELKEGQIINLRISHAQVEIQGKLVAVSKQVKQLNGVQVVLTRIMVDSENLNLLPGLLVTGEVVLPNITVKDYFISIFRN